MHVVLSPFTGPIITEDELQAVLKDLFDQKVKNDTIEAGSFESTTPHHWFTFFHATCSALEISYQQTSWFKVRDSLFRKCQMNSNEILISLANILPQRCRCSL